MLEVQHLMKSYRSKDGKIVNAVRDVHFTLEEGTVLAFLGPNGAGKTTSIKMIGGLVRPDQGDVVIRGHSVLRQPRRALADIGAVLEGSRNLYWRLTPLENFEYWGGIRGLNRKTSRARGRELMSAFGLESKLGSTVQQLSRGMQQQVAICAALVHQPSLLLLDEPTLGLDLEASDRIQSYVLRLAHELGVGILLTTHQMEVAEALADKVAIVQNGEITMSGTKTDILGYPSDNQFVVELAVSIDDDTRRAMAPYDVEWISESSFRVVVDDLLDMHEVMRRLDGRPVIRMERETPDLASVFREHVRRTKEQIEVTN